MKKLFLILCIIAFNAHAALTAFVENTTVSPDDVVTLTLTSTDPSGNNTPDLKPLDKDFEVAGVSTAQSYQSINGKTSQEKSWVISLTPKREGELLIPPLTLNGETSQAITIHVDKSSSKTPNEPALSERIFAEVDVNPGIPLIDAQMTFTIKIYVADNARLDNLQLAPPDFKEAQTQQLGDDRQYEDVRDGKRYHVIVRQYALFAHKAGPLKIEGATISGRRLVAAPIGHDPFAILRDPFFNGGGYSRALPFKISVPAITAEIQPIPENISKALVKTYGFLPAESLSLVEEWSDQNTEIKAGEPITRTLIITAQGLTASTLPNVLGTQSTNYKHYDDAPVLNTVVQNQVVIGSRKESTAYVPEQAGDFTLPALKIPWWNTKKNQLEYATLPAKTFHVIGSAKTAESNTTLTTSTPHEDDNLPNISPTSDIQTAQRVSNPLQWLPWSIASVMTVLWLLTLGLFLHSRKNGSNHTTRHKQPTPQKDEQKLRLAEKITSIKKHLKDRQLSAAAQQIMSYSRERLKIASIYSLNDLLTQSEMHETLRQQLLSLERALYAIEDDDTFDTTACIKVIEHYLPSISPVKKENYDMPLWEGLHPR